MSFAYSECKFFTHLKATFGLSCHTHKQTTTILFCVAAQGLQGLPPWNQPDGPPSAINGGGAAGGAIGEAEVRSTVVVTVCRESQLVRLALRVPTVCAIMHSSSVGWLFPGGVWGNRRCAFCVCVCVRAFCAASSTTIAIAAQ